MAHSYSIVINKFSFQKETAQESLIKLSNALKISPNKIIQNIKERGELCVARDKSATDADKIMICLGKIGVKAVLKEIIEEEINVEDLFSSENAEKISNNNEEYSKADVFIECPLCNERIKKGAMKCKHCGSMIKNPNKQLNLDMNDADVNSVINGLNISRCMKDKFEFIAEKRIIGVKGGFEVSEQTGKISNLSCLPAVFFTFIYYFYYRLWKKGFVILCLQVGGAIFLSSLFSESFAMLFVLVLSLYLGTIAYIDLFRYYVLKADFWW